MGKQCFLSFVVLINPNKMRRPAFHVHVGCLYVERSHLLKQFLYFQLFTELYEKSGISDPSATICFPQLYFCS